MRFWDSSAIVPLVVEEAHTATVEALLATDSEPVLWWGTAVECASAVARAARLGPSPAAPPSKVLGTLRAIQASALEIQPSEEVRSRAMRLLLAHPLRAADALQLAAALLWAGDEPQLRAFVCLDARLREAAEREGFEVLPEVAVR